MDFSIVNVVATASLEEELDFYELKNSRDIFYDSNVYGGRVAYFKRANMQGKVSIFSSGKMISIGTKSKSQAFKELETTVKFLVDKGFTKPTKLKPKVQNMVVRVDFKRTLSLEDLAESRPIIYEPGQFAGAIIHLKKPFKVSVLLFTSGKGIIAGLTESKQIRPTIAQLEKFLVNRTIGTCPV